MTAPELKPCPFCGGEAQSDGENSTYGRSWWTVWCNACEVELRDREVWDKARPGMLDPAYPAGECLERWNTRTDLIPAMLAEAEQRGREAEREECADYIAVRSSRAKALPGTAQERFLMFHLADLLDTIAAAIRARGVKPSQEGGE